MDYKNLFRKIDRNLRTIERSSDLLATLAEILRRLVDDFADDLGLVGGRIYEKKGSSYVLKREYPVARAPKGFKIPATYPPIQALAEHGYVYSDFGDTGSPRTGPARSLQRSLRHVQQLSLCAALRIARKGRSSHP